MIAPDAPWLAAVLERHRWPLAEGEKAVQAAIAHYLTVAGIAHRREVALGAGDIIDFVVWSDAGEVGLEVKLAGAAANATLRQLRRYARHRRLTALVIAGNRAMELPGHLDRMPLYGASLGTMP